MTVVSLESLAECISDWEVSVSSDTFMFSLRHFSG